MRAPAVLVVLAGAALAGACVLPEAVLDKGQESSSTGSMGGSGSSSGSGGSTGPPLANPLEIGELGQVAAVAPSGTSGQRHLFFAASTWWLLQIAGNDTPQGLLIRNSNDFHTWGTQSTALNPEVLSLPVDPIDGRTFGVDVQPRQVGADIVHVSVSGQHKMHARAIVQGGRLLFDSAVDQPAVTPPGGVDATVTTISPAVLQVTDFSSAAATCGSCALDAKVADDQATWSEDFADMPATLDSPTTPAPIPLRVGLAIGGTTRVLWRDATSIRFATRGVPPAPWSTDVLSAEVLDVSARNFAGCVQPGNKDHGPVGHVIRWDPQAGFQHFTSNGSGGWSPATSQPGNDFSGVVNEIFLACGKDHVHAFVIDPTSPISTIHTATATFDGIKATWGSWSPVVITPPQQATRCFLSGFDRMVPGQGVGLLWTESGDCNLAVTQHLFGAVVFFDD